MPGSEPKIIQTKAQHTAVIHLTIPRSGMMSAFGPAIAEVVTTLIAQGQPPTGSAFAHHLKMTPGIFDFEVGFVTATPVASAGRVRSGTWPAQRAAYKTYHGPYEGLPQAWGTFMDWITANGHQPADDLWEHYVSGPQSDPDPATYRTDFYRPLLG